MPENHNIEKIIVLRFSSMGDVAIVASFLQEFREKYPSVEIVVASKPLFQAFFKDIPNVTFHALKADKEHKGIPGLFRLYKELKQFNADAVADLHDNLRSRIVCSFFRFSGIIIKRIDKGRKEKKELTRPQNKIIRQLKTTIERYADVFRQLGFEIDLQHTLIKHPKQLPDKIKPLFSDDKKKIGISPFAQYTYKVYDLSKMQQVLKILSDKGYKMFIFGGSQQEKDIAEQWQNDIPNVYSLVKKCTLYEERAIVSNLDIMLSMDSSGMHLASLEGIPVISVWGPTHPFAGFLGYGQSYDDCLQIDNPSRPTSVYGNKPCMCGNENCIDLITPEQIVKAVENKLK